MSAGPGAYYPPTVLAGCTDTMAGMREKNAGFAVAGPGSTAS
jgi:hypothetical protein